MTDFTTQTGAEPEPQPGLAPEPATQLEPGGPSEPATQVQPGLSPGSPAEPPTEVLPGVAPGGPPEPALRDQARHAPPDPSEQPTEPVPAKGDNLTVEDTLPGAEEPDNPVDLGRIAWSITTVAFLIAMVVLLARRDVGYAGVTLAVAVAAGINLFR